MSLLQSEISVRLVGSPAEVTAFRASLSGSSATRGGWQRNRTSFFDTADGALQRIGLEVAVMETNGESIEKISLVSDHAFPLMRQTYTRKLHDGASVGAATGAPTIDATLAARAIELEETARLEAESWKTVIPRADITVEIEILQGAVQISGTRRAVCEIRIQLLKGSREAFFRLVEDAVRDAHGKLHLAAPGEFLVDAFRAKARKMSLRAEDSAADVFASGLGASSARLMELAPFLALERSAEAARQMRVALRRFRTLERVFRPELKRKTFRRAVDRARALGRSIGAARDWEVFIEGTLSANEIAGYEPRGAARVRELVNDKRGVCWDRVIDVLNSEEFSLLVLDLLRGAYCQQWRVAAPQMEAPIWGFAETALDRHLAKADAVANDINPDAPETQHELRLALKKLRYTAQMFRDLYDKAVRKPYFATLSHMQDMFGVLNDAVVAQERCTELVQLARKEVAGSNEAVVKTLGFILGWRSASTADASRDLADAWRIFRQETPYWRLPDPPSTAYINTTQELDAEKAPQSEHESIINPDAEDTDHSLP